MTNAIVWKNGTGRVPIVNRGTYREMLSYWDSYYLWRKSTTGEPTLSPEGLPLWYPSNKPGHRGEVGEGWISEPPDPMEWPEKYEFEDTLEFLRWERGRSKTLIHLRSVITGNLYPMMMREFTRVLRHKTLMDGVWSGRFTQMKRGANYTLVPTDIGTDEDEDKADF